MGLIIHNRPTFAKVDNDQPTFKLPNPTKEDISSDLFNAIWQVIKDWDIKAPKYYSGVMSGNGSHVKLILDAIEPVIRDTKIDSILKEND